MTKVLRIIFPFLILLLTTLNLSAQENNIEMADMMHQNGKIYVVVAVIAILLAGFLYALLSIDKRVRRLEKENKKP